jgi:hypothetical protein
MPTLAGTSGGEGRSPVALMHVEQVTREQVCLFVGLLVCLFALLVFTQLFVL